MDDAPVAGQHKHSPSILSALDRRTIERLVPRVPRSMRSRDLTMLTLVWSGLILAGDALAVRNRAWLFAVSLVVAIQYVTDAIDGKLGVLRGEGLVRWGFYMDHLLDYVFLCSIVLGYALLVPPQLHWLMMAILVVAVGFMVSSFLACAVEGGLGISYLRIGPVEIRLLFIAINTWLGLGGRAPLATILPLVLIASLTTWCSFVARTQRRLWDVDNHQSKIPFANRQSPIRQSVADRQSAIV
jgi:phosphatidylglycerophosphate synthase